MAARIFSGALLALYAVWMQSSSAEEVSWVTLGTAGGPMAHVERSQPANALIVDGKPYLVDAGNGVLRQLAAAKIRYTDIDVIFISHHHDDHDADMGTVIGASWDRGRKKPVHVFGPPGTEDAIGGYLQFFAQNARIRTSDVPRPEAREIFVAHDVPRPGVVYKDDHISVTAVENSHFAGLKKGTPAFGKDKSFAYRFDTKSRSIVFTGDTGPSEATTRLAQGVDLLVTEVIDPDGMARLLKTFYVNKTDEEREAHLRHFLEDHLTPEEIGKMAQKASVKAVVLTHVVPGDDGETDEAPYVAGVRKYYNGPVTLARDLMRF